MAVGMQAFQGKKKAAPANFTAVIGKPGNMRVKWTMLFDYVDFCK